MALPRNARGGYTIGGVKYPSVTEILSAGIPKPALTSWAARSVAEAAVLHPNEWIPIAKRDQQAAIDLLKGSPWRERDKGASLGSQLHRAMECDTLGLPMPEMDETVSAMFERARLWSQLWTWELAEATILNQTIGYAGTLDGVIKIKVPLGRFPAGSRLMIDFKTNKKGRQGHGLYPECSWQMAGYDHAEVICLPDGSQVPMIACDGAVALWVRADECHLYEVEIGPPAWRAFLAAFEVAKVVWDNTTHWIGNEIMMPEDAAYEAAGWSFGPDGWEP